jgi:hypothetical protein
MPTSSTISGLTKHKFEWALNVSHPLQIKFHQPLYVSRIQLLCDEDLHTLCMHTLLVHLVETVGTIQL